MSRHVVITGAGGGIGAAIAAELAQLDCRVTGVDLRAAELGRSLGGLPGAEGVVADLGDAEDVATLTDRIWDHQGPIDVLVNAAGIYPARDLLQLSANLWDRVQAVNVRAPFVLTRDLARRAIADGRRPCVVNISSGAAQRARPGAAHYSTSKAAVEMLTKCCAVELGEYGIRVNAVSPGFVTVDSEANPVTEEYAAAVSVNPLGRRGEPSDIAAAVAWLVSDRAPWVTGSVLRVDGGASAGTTTLPYHWPGLSALQTPDDDQGGNA